MQNSNKPDPGLFTVKGDKIGIKDFSFSIDEAGQFKSSPVVLTSGVDMTPYWLDIGFQHLKNTETWHKKLMLAKESKDEVEIGRCLKKESYYGMQSIMASGVAVDAYHANIKSRIKISAELTRAWHQKRTARYKQISEVLRLAFPMSNSTFRELRNNVKQIFTWRDNAVHPNSEMSLPSVHIELNKITDSRYVKFRFYNAKIIYALTLCIVYKTASNPPITKNSKFLEYCEDVVPKMEPWVKKWEKRYGTITWEYT